MMHCRWSRVDQAGNSTSINTVFLISAYKMLATRPIRVQLTQSFLQVSAGFRNMPYYRSHKITPVFVSQIHHINKKKQFLTVPHHVMWYQVLIISTKIIAKLYILLKNVVESCSTQKIYNPIRFLKHGCFFLLTLFISLWFQKIYNAKQLVEGSSNIHY